MHYVTVGTASSQQEFGAVTAALKGERLYQAAELLPSLAAIEREGFAGQSALWEEVSNEPTIKVYFGIPERGSEETAIWAAIEIGADGKSVTLLKITDAYTGGTNESNDLLADAIHRRDRSKA